MTLKPVSLDLMTYIGLKTLDFLKISSPISHDFLFKNLLAFRFDSIDLVCFNFLTTYTKPL